MSIWTVIFFEKNDLVYILLSLLLFFIFILYSFFLRNVVVETVKSYNVLITGDIAHGHDMFYLILFNFIFFKGVYLMLEGNRSVMNDHGIIMSL
jgi:hypothetical protein